MSIDNIRDKNTIIETAIRILNKRGLNGLSMRNLANELEIKASSIYWHFKSKGELLIAISEYICKECNYNINYNSPREELINVSQNYRFILKSIKDSAGIMQLTPPITPKRQELINHIIKCLIDFGVPNDKLFISSTLLNNYIISFVLDEYIFISCDDNISFNIPNLRLPVKSLNLDTEFLNGINIILDGFKQTSHF